MKRYYTTQRPKQHPKNLPTEPVIEKPSKPVKTEDIPTTEDVSDNNFKANKLYKSKYIGEE